MSEVYYVIEHRRVVGGDWIRVQTVGEDLVEVVRAQLDVFNLASGVGDWRLRPIGAAPVAPRPAPAPVDPKRLATRWERVRFWWILRFSKRAR